MSRLSKNQWKVCSIHQSISQSSASQSIDRSNNRSIYPSIHQLYKKSNPSTNQSINFVDWPSCRRRPWRACRTEPAAHPSPAAAAPSAPAYIPLIIFRILLSCRYEMILFGSGFVFWAKRDTTRLLFSTTQKAYGAYRKLVSIPIWQYIYMCGTMFSNLTYNYVNFTSCKSPVLNRNWILTRNWILIRKWIIILIRNWIPIRYRKWVRIWKPNPLKFRIRHDPDLL